MNHTFESNILTLEYIYLGKNSLKYLYEELFEGWRHLSVGEVSQYKTQFSSKGMRYILKSSVRDHGWEYGLRLIQCLSFFSCCMKYSDQSNLRENRLTLAQSPKVKSITVTKPQQRALEEVGPVAGTVKEQGKKDANARLLLSMLYRPGSPLSRRYYSQGAGLPISIR